MRKLFYDITLGVGVGGSEINFTSAGTRQFLTTLYHVLSSSFPPAFMVFSLFQLLLGLVGLVSYYAFKNYTYYAVHFSSLFMYVCTCYILELCHIDGEDYLYRAYSILQVFLHSNLTSHSILIY